MPVKQIINCFDDLAADVGAADDDDDDDDDDADVEVNSISLFSIQCSFGPSDHQGEWQAAAVHNKAKD